MLISHSEKIIFIHIHRTGGTTIENLLMKALGGKAEILSQHGNNASDERLLLTRHPSYFVFSFVRNPWDRILSWYALSNKWGPNNGEISPQKFLAYLKSGGPVMAGDPFFHYNQLDYLPVCNQDQKPVNIFRFENFVSETSKLFKTLGLPVPEIPIINNTPKKNYREFYSEESKALIAEKCHKDIAYFKYSF